MTEQEFTDWFCKNYPKDTEIHDPMWHASRIYRRAQLAAPVLPNCAGCGGTGQLPHRGGYTACYACGGSGVGDAQLAAPEKSRAKFDEFLGLAAEAGVTHLPIQFDDAAPQGEGA